MNKLKKKETNISIIGSILIAFVIWIYVIGEVDPNVKQRFNNIPVTIENLQVLEENGLVISKEEDLTVDITLYGRTSTMYGLRNRITASIDATDITEKGTYDLYIEISGIPDNIELQETHPNSIAIEVDRLAEDERRVELNIVGEPASGLVILGYSIDPDIVSIDGPEDILNNVSKIKGDINVKDAKDNLNQSVELYPVDSEDRKVEGVSINTQTANVTVQIGGTKELEIKPEIKGKIADGYVVSEIVIEPKSIVVGARKNLLDNIEEIVTEAINLDGINDSFEEEVSLILPSDIKIIEGDSTVLVKVVVQRVESREYSIDNIELVNKPEDIDITFEEQTITVTLRAITEVLDSIKNQELKLILDLEDIDIGENDVKLLMEDIDDVTIQSIIPGTIQVIATETSP
ncbi:CdaR family protein [Alkalibaculum sporogenes]|uniref:CdaR family protein n=1 Tax=Alkalibaculum sporogenes TaxID=2655001 RepID=UPI00187BBB51